MALSPTRRAAFAIRFQRASELPMLVLAVVFLIVIALPDLIDLADDLRVADEAVEWGICALFACELAVNTYLASDRKRYLVSHWLDVITVAVPFVRPLRLIRVLVVGARFWSDARILLRKHTFGLVAVASVSAAGLAAALEYAAERAGDGPIQTFADALWWAAGTVTTVGYGDMYPRTMAGRAVALALMVVGVSVFGLLTARVAAFFLASDTGETKASAELAEVLERLDRIEQRLEAQRP